MNLDPDKFTISFIIPVLNGEKYIKGCLESILSEMAPDDEIIVVDNGSTDGTLAIVSSYLKVKCLSYPKVTISALRNRGAEIAKGNLLAFIDCDCLVCPGWRQAAVEVLSDESVAATGSHYDLPEKASWVEAAWKSSRKHVATSVRYIPSGNFVIRSDTYRAICGFDETMVTDEDTDIGTRLIQGGLGIIDDPQVRVIHLGNPKTICQFIRKEKWHSTSILQKVTWRTMDKPMVMTLAFLVLVMAAVATLPGVTLGRIDPIVPMALVLIIPLITALYRLYQFHSYMYFFQQIVLYLLFYSVRALTVIENIIWSNSQKRS